MIKVALIIRSLDCGGAERQLLTLARALDKRRFEITILTFYSDGIFEEELQGSGVRLITLNKGGRWDLIRFSARLIGELKKFQPDVIHSYLDIPNIVTVLAKPFCFRSATVWGIRSTNLDLNNCDWLHRVGFSFERRLAHFARHIIVNSRAGHSYLLSRGFPAEKLVMIPNGFDSQHFQPNAEARLKVRTELAVAHDQILIGLVARLDPIKDHRTFLRAAKLLSERCPRMRFVCVGTGPELYRQKLFKLAEEFALGDKVIWTGLRRDVADVYNALDVNVLCSITEGCPNVVGEAMACGIPCVVTDTGDAARIVGDTGFVCEARNPQALAATILKCIGADRGTLGINARRRIENQWNISRLIERTEKILMPPSTNFSKETASLLELQP
jgi:glycosyltransferase involved in cell wall biosynthesis